tara:strand:+ start:9973 stop:10263 length:291 start_codon:yes stop_codon:yes gene_type:complete
MSKYKTEEPWLYVEITKPTTEEIESYYTRNNEMKTSGTAQGAISVFKKAKILHTFDEIKYPIGSNWMIGEVPGIRINFFGEKLTMIQKTNLYARID